MVSSKIKEVVLQWLCKSKSCEEHNQHAKHAITRGSEGMPPRKIFKSRCSEIASDSIFKSVLAIFHALDNTNFVAIDG